MKKALSLLILSLFANINATTQTTIIMTHGANDSGSGWYKPGDHFLEEVASQAALQFENATLVPFSWKQPLNGITYLEILNGANDLANLIIDLTQTETPTDIILVGHSFGGHVIKVASQFLNQAQAALTLEKITTNEQITNMPTQIDNELYKKLRASIQEKLSKITTKDNFSKEYLIDAAYTLGTPNVHYPEFLADMSVIGQFFNLYSDGDDVQDKVANKTVPEHERKVNLKIVIKEYDGALTNPSHSGLTCESVGHRILSIPSFFEYADEQGDAFTFEKNGIITFPRNIGEEPVYKIDLNPVEEKYHWTCMPLTCAIPCIMT
ncbi:hypothetical protein KAT92_04785 [Candidatus Babeliales bacterium]|nr:hypothetical protein [Candidatus Babeliales bacterium]